eukprot:sb/3474543/
MTKLLLISTIIVLSLNGVICWNSDPLDQLADKVNDVANHAANDIVQPLANQLGFTVEPPLQHNLHEIKDGVENFSRKSGFPMEFIIALGVGVPLILIGLIVCCCCCCCGCCRRKKETAVYVRMDPAGGVENRYEQV